MHNRTLTGLGCLVFFFVSCSQGLKYEHFVNASEKGWPISDTAVFTVAIADTLATYNVFLHLRHTGNYPYANIFLFVETHAPTGAMAIDTMEYHWPRVRVNGMAADGATCTRYNCLLKCMQHFHIQAYITLR
ncbi:MAG: gliding motility lipoprotein GldH [Bacteroidales bacterium]|nr:gliding motility lipoprotein GldH [Bacteroidales bacterium]